MRVVAFAALLAGMTLLAGCNEGAQLALENLRATDSAREDEKSVDEIQRDITAAQAEVDRTIRAAENLGTYYRLLSVAYLNRQMYGEALDALEDAIRYYPENEQLTYYGGLAAARMAKALVDDPEETARLLGLAEKYYQRTLYLYQDHRPALFGLAVLYTFELNRPAEAVPLLKKILARDTSYTEAKMILARAHAAMSNIDEAIDLYNEIIRSDVSEEIKTQARENIKVLQGS